MEEFIKKHNFVKAEMNPHQWNFDTGLGFAFVLTAYDKVKHMAIVNTANGNELIRGAFTDRHCEYFYNDLKQYGGIRMETLMKIEVEMFNL